MKACLIQPPYSMNRADSDAFFEEKLRLLDSCPADCDLIVLPEYSDVPCASKDKDELLADHVRYMPRLLEKCAETAKRCQATVFFNALDEVDGAYRNTTFAMDQSGKIVDKYYKTHIPPGEKALDVAWDYTTGYDAPKIMEIGGVRYGFLTCYDFYFYEAFSQLARSRVDVIVGCSLQRSDTAETSEIICRFLAYQTNAYVLRASVTFGEASPVCGGTMAVAPDGNVLANMKSHMGMAAVEFDPQAKFAKPAGFGRAPAAHWEYVEEGRNPWQYRPAGSAICLDDARMPYPRVCAHRGFNTVTPENTLPAYGAAVAMGAPEIELDLWRTKDGVLVSSHDPTLERTSNGQGKIWDYTYEELMQLDFGVKRGEAFSGLRIARFEDILQKFACHTIMNIHVKIWDMEFEESMLPEIVALIRKYDCAKWCYFMTVSDKRLIEAKAYAPDIAICVGHDENRPWAIVDRAIAIGAQKVQLYRPFFNRGMVEKAHAHGIICNVFFADTPEDAREYLDMGIDCLLSNDYHRIAQTMEAWKKENA